MTEFSIDNSSARSVMNFAHLAKGSLPMLSTILMHRGSSRIVEAVATGASMIQGLGSGTAWDLSSEIKAMSTVVNSTEPTIIDIGANVGEWSTAAARHYPRYRRIIMVEPNAPCLAELEKLKLRDTIIVPSAASDAIGTATFHTVAAGYSWGASSLFERKDTYFRDIQQTSFTVPTTTIDSVLKDLDIDRVDFMKMDIEGAELSALVGAQDSLRSGVVKALSFEFGSGNINSRTFFRDFWDLLTPLGYSINRILADGRLWPVAKYSEELEYFRGVSNFIACLEQSS